MVKGGRIEGLHQILIDLSDNEQDHKVSVDEGGVLVLAVPH